MTEMYLNRQLFHAISHETLSRLQKGQTKKYFGIQPGVSFIYSSQRLNQVSVRHQDITEQGLKRRKVIGTVKKGIVDKEVLNEPKMPILLVDIKKIYISFCRLGFLLFHVFMFLLEWQT